MSAWDAVAVTIMVILSPFAVIAGGSAAMLIVFYARTGWEMIWERRS